MSTMQQHPQAISSRHDPNAMKALQVTGFGLTSDHLHVRLLPKPQVKPGFLLVHVRAAALNPIDVALAEGKIKCSSLGLPFTLGCDMAGVVEDVGPGYTTFRPGDKVCGFTGFGENRGTLAEYCLIPDELAIRKPDHLAFPEAATIGVASLTAALGLFRGTNLPLPSKSTLSNLPEPWYCLVWGASGSVGSMAVQLAKAAGFVVIGVCSPHNFGMVRQLGATYVVDRMAPDAVEQIKKFSQGKLRLAFDAVSSPTTTEKACASLSTTLDVAYSSVLPVRHEVPSHVHVYEISLGKASIDSLVYLSKVTEEITMLLASHVIKPNAVDRLHGGLNVSALIQGLMSLKEGAVSAKKEVLVIYQQ